MLNIIHEDNHILVVVKQPNIPTQEDSTKDRDMLTLIKEYLKVKYNKPGNIYVGLVHRLDRPVGGVMVFAKTSKAASRLSNQVRLREIEKTYLAVVKGKPEIQTQTLIDYLQKDEKTNTSKVVDNEFEGKKAVLHYEILEYNKESNTTLLKIRLETGRHHQIRVQLSTIGNPIVGDQRYGTEKELKQIALWAYELSFFHPTTKEKLTFKNVPKQIGTWENFKKLKLE